MMKYIKLSIYFSLFILVAACSYSNEYSYNVINDSDYEIEVVLESPYLDSTYTIMSKGSRRVLIYYSRSGGKNGPIFHDVKEDLSALIISNSDTISSVNYLNNSTWSFQEGYYTTTVRNEIFE